VRGLRHANPVTGCFPAEVFTEKPEDVLMRIANDKRSPDYNQNQLEAKSHFAQTEADVSPAFQALQNEIIRLST
jgi:hypothetical protein